MDEGDATESAIALWLQSSVGSCGDQRLLQGKEPDVFTTHTGIRRGRSFWSASGLCKERQASMYPRVKKETHVQLYKDGWQSTDRRCILHWEGSKDQGEEKEGDEREREKLFLSTLTRTGRRFSRQVKVALLTR